LGVNRCAVFSS